MARRTKAEAEATRSALLDAAERVFQLQGVSRTSLSHIAQAAGVTRGAVYWHFQDKADLFSAMMQRVKQPMHEQLARIDTDNAALDPIQVMCLRFDKALQQISGDAQTRRVLEIANLMVEHLPELGLLRERRIEATTDNIAILTTALTHAATQRGVTLPAPAIDVARGAHALMMGLVTQWLLDPVFDLPATGRISLRAYLQGIGLPPLDAVDVPNAPRRD